MSKLGNRFLYPKDENSTAEIKAALRAFDVDVEQRIRDADLEFRDTSNVYVDSGFDPAQVITTLEDQANDSVDEGYAGLWVAGENSWRFHTDHSFDHILDFEADFDAICPDLRRCEEKAPPFTAGMNPTTPRRTTFDVPNGYLSSLRSYLSITEAVSPPH